MTTLILCAAVCALLLAFANGANDNFKGVATLFGSGVADYSRALRWGTVTTLAGSVAAVWFAHTLVQTFSGRGLVPDDVAAVPSFGIAVAIAAAATVGLATRLGFPISSTHAIAGSLLGAGAVATGGAVNLSVAGRVIFLPLLLSPLLAVAAVAILYPCLRALRRRLGVEPDSCACLGISGELPSRVAMSATNVNLPAPRSLLLATGHASDCMRSYSGAVFGLRAATLIDSAHFLSAGAVGFARGLNDTPKIAALLLIGASLPAHGAFVAVAGAMALGGWLAARRVAETMAHKVTSLSPGQGLAANLVTSALVLGASCYGLPVSTTHVSCGALFGVGAVTGQAHWRMIATIVLAWIGTLPVSLILGPATYWLLERLT